MKTTLPLKPVPLVNGANQNLEVCAHCHGTATHYEAKRYRPGTTIEETAHITQKQVKVFEKDGWHVKVQKCENCKGAGMVLSNTAHTW